MLRLPTALLWLGLSPLTAAEPSPPPVLAQQEMGDWACGPVSVINSLLHARDTAALRFLEGEKPIEKARSFAARFGSSPSLVYGQPRPAYSETAGTTDLDLLAMVQALHRQLNKPAPAGLWLVRQPDESAAAFLARFEQTLQSSIQAGFPPLLSVRSAKADTPPDQAQDDAPIQWWGIYGHWVAVTAVHRLPTDDPLLTLTLADSLSGKQLGALVHAGHPRQAKVPMRFTVDAAGKEKWTWEGSDDCLFLCAPSLPLGTHKTDWHRRTYIAARYLIHLPDATENPKP